MKFLQYVKHLCVENSVDLKTNLYTKYTYSLYTSNDLTIDLSEEESLITWAAVSTRQAAEHPVVVLCVGLSMFTWKTDPEF